MLRRLKRLAQILAGVGGRESSDALNDRAVSDDEVGAW